MGGDYNINTTRIYSGQGSIIGNSNVPFLATCYAKQGSSGTTFRGAIVISGSVFGAEFFTVISEDATSTDWTKYSGTATPVVNDQLAAYFIAAAALNTQDVDFAEPVLIQGRTTIPLAWRATSTINASTATPVHSFTNVGNARYAPLKGSVTIRLADFQGTAGATFLSCGLATAKGALVLDYNAGELRLRIWDNAAALITTVNCGALTTAEHILDVSWNAVAGTMSVKEGTTTLGSYSGAAWTPSAVDVTPIYIGSNNGTNAANAFIARVQFFNK
jgi:hypothetical protein